MEPKRNLIIADSHHRYETALTYHQRRQTNWRRRMLRSFRRCDTREHG